MPDQPGGKERQTKDHVKQYLEKQGVSADELGDNTHEALNSLSQEELDALGKVGDALKKDSEEGGMAPSAVH